MARKNVFNDKKLFSIFCYLRERSTATQYVKYKCELEILTKSKLREEVKTRRIENFNPNTDGCLDWTVLQFFPNSR